MKLRHLSLILLLACFPLWGQSGSPKAAADLKSVEDFNRAFVDSCRNMDTAATIKLWADDGVDLLPGMQPMVGKPAISEWLNGVAQHSQGVKMLQCDVDWKSIQTVGDVTYEWGMNTQTVSLPNKPEPMKNSGKITLILRRQADSTWKLALESWNSNPSAER